MIQIVSHSTKNGFIFLLQGFEIIYPGQMFYLDERMICRSQHRVLEKVVKEYVMPQ